MVYNDKFSREFDSISVVRLDLRWFCREPVPDEVLSGFQAQAPVAVLEPATEESLQISVRSHYPLCRYRPSRWKEDHKTIIKRLTSFMLGFNLSKNQ
ncbi:hypothetical protein PoB_001202800 [Plakobranchus ocellatus]|uniref:Uncharacterized protein n=1 Tax=Plakobranchus ocellatus TaxID=259542 RepID=A0AAV3YTE5_9GAST|nr:hypothetical protein PoB_001202800 [Plakobranchus ocellatus]